MQFKDSHTITKYTRYYYHQMSIRLLSIFVGIWIDEKNKKKNQKKTAAALVFKREWFPLSIH